MAVSATARRFLRLTPELVAPAVRCVATAFGSQQEDPFSRAFHYRSHMWAEMSGGFITRASMSKQALSTISVDPVTSAVDGVMICEDWMQHTPPAYLSLPPEWQPTRAIFRELHERFNATPMAPKVEGVALHCLYFTCVQPSSRSAGVMKGLWAHTIEAARDYGFQYMIAEAGTEKVRQVILNKLGFEEVASVGYEDFGQSAKIPAYVELARADPYMYSRLSLSRRRVPSDLYV